MRLAHPEGTYAMTLTRTLLAAALCLGLAGPAAAATELAHWPAPAAKQLDALIAREIERGVAPEKIFLAGFSQGGAIILTAALSRTAPLAGLIALSTYLPEAESARRVDGAVQVPAFMAHGSSDPVIPQAVAVHSAQALQALGLEVEWHSYPMAHQVCAEEIQALGDWLQERLGAA